MKPKTMIWSGGVGAGVAALCCFTPILAVALTAAGLAAWLGWIDWVLFPALALSLALLFYGLRKNRQAACKPAPE